LKKQNYGPKRDEAILDVSILSHRDAVVSY
jgi:hypothetical protein